MKAKRTKEVYSAMKERLKDILLNTNSNNRITSGEVANIFNIESNDGSHFVARQFIKDTIKEYNLPVVSNTKGYFLIGCKEDFETYMNNLNSRILGIDARKQLISNIYHQYKGNI